MICALTGTLRQVLDDRVEVESGPIVYELLIPASDVQNLKEQVGQSVTFRTLLYLEGDPNRGNLEPRLLGFMTPRDKRFFDLFTSVNGIGPRKALRALAAPIPDIARAIEAGNTRFLVELPQIGKRLAEQIVATLAGKLGAFAGETVQRGPGASVHRRSNEEEAAIAILISPQMGLRRPEAEALLERVKLTSPEMKTAEQFVPEMLKLHSAR